MPLQAPSQAAPTGVNITASSVSSPNSVPTAPSVTASSVTSPNASVSSPSTVSSVTSPSSSSTPVSSVSSVTPPVSSVKPVGTNTVKPLFLYEGKNGELCDTEDGYASDRPIGNACYIPRNMDEYSASLEAEKNAKNGDPAAKAELEFRDSTILAGHTCAKSASASGGNAESARGECKQYVRDLRNSDIYNSMNPSQRLHFWQITQGGLQSGDIGRDEMQEMVRFSNRCRLIQGGRAVDCWSDGMQAKSSSRVSRAFLLPAVALGVAGIFMLAAGATTLFANGVKAASMSLSNIRVQLPWLSGDRRVPGSWQEASWAAAGAIIGTALSSTQTEPVKPTNGDGDFGATGELPNLGGMTQEEADEALEGSGFTKGSTTKGGYTKYTHPDGSVVWIGPDGEIDRIPTRGSNTGLRTDGNRCGKTRTFISS
jgi:hypothetical protein